MKKILFILLLLPFISTKANTFLFPLSVFRKFDETKIIKMSLRIIYKEGEKIGACTYLRDAENKGIQRRAVFLCHCGSEFIQVISFVKVGAVVECRNCAMYLPGTAIKGTSFLEERPNRGRRRIGLFKCKHCGNEFESMIENIASGGTTSCGCIQKERRGKATITHGYSRSRKKSHEYKMWLSMRERCLCKTNKGYKNYGGRGIKICERWLNKENGFINFLSDIGKQPSPAYSLDRIDVNGNYEPSNCRWATRTDQARNKRNNILIEYRGETKCLKEWCYLTGLNYAMMYGRVIKNRSQANIVFQKTIKEKNVKIT